MTLAAFHPRNLPPQQWRSFSDLPDSVRRRMRFQPPSIRPARFLPVLAVLVAMAPAGCGKGSETAAHRGGGPVPNLAPVAEEGAVTVPPRNTTRVGGADPVLDAASVARVVYPGLTATSRPQAVVVVDRGDWPAALAASPLAGAPLNAPILYSEGGSLPPVSREALEAMHPTGSAALGGAQVIRVGTQAALPTGFVARTLPNGDPAGIATEVEKVLSTVAGAQPKEAVVVGLAGARSFQMPAAGLAAVSAVPLLPVGGGELPAATETLLESMHHPAVYV